MELRQLKYFVRTAETLNFSEAARSLYITQSTLSQQIKTLEDELGSPLFIRDSHNVTLTECGERMLPLAKQTLMDAENCKSQIRDLQEIVTGTLNIGATFSFSPILKETIKKFTAEYPGVRLNITNRSMEELMEMLRRREVDFVLAFKPNVPYDDVIESYVLFEDRLSVIMRKGHPLAGCSSLGVDELKKHRLAIPAKGLQARNMIDKYFNFVDAGFNVSLEVNGVYSLLDVVENSNLLTILSDATIRDRHALKAIALDVPDNEMQGCVHILKNTYKKRSAEVFVKMLRESLALMELSGKWA